MVLLKKHDLRAKARSAGYGDTPTERVKTATRNCSYSQVDYEIRQAGGKSPFTSAYEKDVAPHLKNFLHAEKGDFPLGTNPLSPNSVDLARTLKGSINTFLSHKPDSKKAELLQIVLDEVNDLIPPDPSSQVKSARK